MSIHRQEVYDAIHGHKPVALGPGWLKWRDGVIVRLVTSGVRNRFYEMVSEPWPAPGVATDVMPRRVVSESAEGAEQCKA